MKIAIVSTYRIECGIARFSEIIEKGLSGNNQVTVFELPPHELKTSFGATKRGAELFLKKLCSDLESYDAVSVQCEYSLFADSMPLSVERIKRVLSANRNTTLTLHTVINRSSSADTAFPHILKWIAAPKTTARNFAWSMRSTMAAREELKLFDFVRKNKVKVIVHTETTKMILRQRFRLPQVDCHPLCYTSAAEKPGFNHLECRSELADKLLLQKSAKLIGVFGFFGNYKGFDYAIKCLARLPVDFKLVVFAGLHPNLIKGSDSSLIDQLIVLAKRNKVLDRIYFMGNVDDRSLYRAIAGVDYAWLPYREVGQEASAICSEVGELAQRMLVSRNFAFIDYMKFGLRNDYEFFEIGNVEELRLKTMLYDRFHKPEEAIPSIQDHAERQAHFYSEVLTRAVA